MKPQRLHKITGRGQALVTALLVITSLWLPLKPALADEGIAIAENGVSYSFAQQATFTLHATSDAEIIQVYLFFRATGETQTHTQEIDIEPGQDVQIDQVHDLRYSPLPPFADVTYWWQIDDSAERQVTTDPQLFAYVDNRFDWEQIDNGRITVYWIKDHGNPAFGQTALDIAQISLEEANIELRAPLPESIDIYMYDAADSLNAAMVLAGRNWVGGQAHPDLGAIVVAIPFEDGYRSRMMHFLSHEVTHLLIYNKVTPPGYRYVPEWLDEGLATANERLPTPEYTIMLEQARAEGELLSLEALCVPFSPNPQTAYLSYAQSGSVVTFIRNRYGAPKIRELLESYAEGASCTSGVEETLNVSLSGLETAWRASLEPMSPCKAWVSRVGVWVGLWLAGLLAAIPMIGNLRRRS